MTVSWTPVAPAMLFLKVAKARVELARRCGHDLLRIACLPVPPLGCLAAAPGPRGSDLFMFAVRTSRPIAIHTWFPIQQPRPRAIADDETVVGFQF